MIDTPGDGRDGTDGPDGPSLDDALSAALAPVLGPVRIADLRRLTGGASRETWSFDAVPLGDSGDSGDSVVGETVHRLILRRDPPRRPGPRGAMAREARCISAAARAGLAVPEVLVHSEDPSVLGAAGIVMARIEGETIARRILRDDRYEGARGRLAEDCGRFLAGMHQLDPAVLGRVGADVPGSLGASGPMDPGDEGPAEPDPLSLMRATLDELGEPSPTFEYALRWLESHRPPPSGPPALVHGDFRLGNLMVDDDGLRAVLDWELAHLGDPVEDLGWLCVRAWRFGAAPPVGGFAERAQLLDAYRRGGGVEVSPEALHWWEVYGTLRWGVICMVQASVFLRGHVDSVELAAIGRRVGETEWDLLLLLAPESTERAIAASAAAAEAADAVRPAAEDLHGHPTAVELLGAVRKFLVDDLMPATSGGVAFHARVAANVVDQVAREIAAAPGQSHVRAAQLADLGVASEAELAAAIRDGRLASFDRASSDDDSSSSDGAAPALVDLLASGVFAKVSVANPRYLAAP